MSYCGLALPGMQQVANPHTSAVAVEANPKRTYPCNVAIGETVLRIDIIADPRARFILTSPNNKTFTPLALPPFRNSATTPTPEDERDLDAWLDMIRENLANQQRATSS